MSIPVRFAGLGKFIGSARRVSGIGKAKQNARLPSGFKLPFTDKDFLKGVKQLENQMAIKFKDTLVQNIKTNRYHYSLGEKTLARTPDRKAPVPLYDTGAYVEKGIVVEGKNVTLSAKKHPRSKMSFLEIGTIQEYGRKDRNIIGRPIWRDTHRAFEETQRAMLVKFLYPKGKKR